MSLLCVQHAFRKIHILPWKRSHLEGSISCSKISIKFSSFMLASQKCKWALPRALIQLHTTIEPGFWLLIWWPIQDDSEPREIDTHELHSQLFCTSLNKWNLWMYRKSTLPFMHSGGTNMQVPSNLSLWNIAFKQLKNNFHTFFDNLAIFCPSYRYLHCTLRKKTQNILGSCNLQC